MRVGSLRLRLIAGGIVAILVALSIAGFGLIVLFQRPLGIAMLIGGAMILSVGVFWMSRVVKVEV